MAEKRTPEGMAAKIAYNSQYDKDMYDKILFRVPKGRKEEIKAEANKRGMSLAAFILAAIERFIR